MSGNPVIRFFRALGGNLVAAILMLVFRRSALRWLTATPGQFLLMLALSLMASFGFDYLNEGQPGEVQLAGFAVYLMPPFFMTVFGVWLSHRYAAWRLGLAPVVAWLGADMLMGFLVLLLQLAGQHGLLPAQAADWMSWVYMALFFWPVLAVVALFGRAVGWHWWQDGLVAALVFLVFFGWFLDFSEQRMWEAVDDDAQVADEPLAKVTEEEVFYAQPELLAEATSALLPGRKGKVDWYFVGVAGDSYQNVFRREIQSVRKLFDTRFRANGRSAVLINNDETALTDPIATRTGLARVLKAVGSKMNSEDVLFLFLSSHGGSDHTFELSYDPLQLEPITPEWLRGALDEAGIKQRVVAISACYSGGFIPALKSPDTIVMTASDATHTSFGCSDEADFTYFGKAFFNEAMRHQQSIEGAFDEAHKTLAVREKAEGFTPSNPQIYIGDVIAKRLPALDASLFPPAK
jgi:hypothetical protein